MMQRRSFRFRPDTEFKQSEDGKFGYFSGYAAVFNNVDSYDEVIQPGAFTRTLNALRDSGRKLPMLWQHFFDVVLGCWPKVEEDEKGLKVEGELNLEVEKAREAYALLKQGAISGMSIGFETISESKVNGKRSLDEIKLWEASPVTFPANELALVSAVKSIGGLSLQSLESAIETLTSIRSAMILDPSAGHSGDAVGLGLDASSREHLAAMLQDLKSKNDALLKEREG